VVLPLLGELAGFDASSVRVVPLAPPNPQTFGSALAEGRVDAIMQFVVGQPAIEAVSGGPVRVLPYSDWITDMYGSGIGVSAELARRDPQLVRRFNAAAIRGLEHAIAYPDEAGEMFAAAHEQHDPQAAAAEVRALAPYVRPSSGVQGPLQQGEISPVRLAQNIAVLEALGAVGPGIASEDVAVFGLAR
jgi:NitT/TauT family transport system substrate-binding protein